ncbi:MAG: hypothetical protein KDD14_16910, partial [Saprospiraceae bacterium]|nr:hypothetical protein [Saprospiraceae bacterium]
KFEILKVVHPLLTLKLMAMGDGGGVDKKAPPSSIALTLIGSQCAEESGSISRATQIGNMIFMVQI